MRSSTTAAPSSQHEHDLIQIFVQPALGACVLVTVPQHATVRDIQTAASDHTGLLPSDQTVTLNGKSLTGCTVLSSLSLTCGSVFRVHAALAGGADRDGEVKQSEVARLNVAASAAPVTVAPPPVPTPLQQPPAAPDAPVVVLVRAHTVLEAVVVAFGLFVPAL